MTSKILGNFYAGSVGSSEFEVVTIEASKQTEYAFMPQPCAQCPWRKDAPIGAFPADAFRHSANTAQDLSTHAFSCHMAGKEEPKTCAGFLIAGAEHNLGVRLAIAENRFEPDAVHSTVDLYAGYREMAIANGVPADDEALKTIRGSFVEEVRLKLQGRGMPESEIETVLARYK